MREIFFLFDGRTLIYLVILYCSLSGCSYKSYVKPRDIKTAHEALLAEVSCDSASSSDTFCLRPLGFEGISKLLQSKKRKLNLVCLENTYCPGFYRKYLPEIPGFDSISDLSTLTIFEEKYTDIPTMRKRLSILKYYGEHYILDEKDFGRYRDDRTKNKVFLDHFVKSEYKILNTPFKYLESTKSFPKEYHYLSATMYILFDSNLNLICVSTAISPNDVKRILHGEKPLQ